MFSPQRILRLGKYAGNPYPESLRKERDIRDIRDIRGSRSTGGIRGITGTGDIRDFRDRDIKGIPASV